MQAVLRQILDNKQFQLTQLLVGSPMMLRECLYIIIIGRPSFQQCLHIREQCFLLVLHMTTYLMGVFVVESQYQSGQRVIFVQRLRKFSAYKGQLEVKEIGVTGFQIMHQRRNTDLLIGIKLTITVDGIVDHSQESIGIYIIILTCLFHGLITEAKTDAETAKRLQQVIIIADQRDHLIVRFIHLLKI